jgi:hypothetical protein
LRIEKIKASPFENKLQNIYWWQLYGVWVTKTHIYVSMRRPPKRHTFVVREPHLTLLAWQNKYQIVQF